MNPPRSAAYTPIFQCLINYRPGLGKETIGGCEFEYQSVEVSKTGEDLILDIADDPNGGAICMLNVRKDLYQEREADILIKSYGKFAEAFASDPSLVLAKPDIYNSRDVGLSLEFGQGRL